MCICVVCVFGMVFAGVREVGEVFQVGLEVLAILDKVLCVGTYVCTLLAHAVWE